MLKGNLKYWIGIILIEAVIIRAINYYQPLCEPCLPGQYCPPCISAQQIYLTRLAIGLGGLFIVWQTVKIFRRRKIFF